MAVTLWQIELLRGLYYLLTAYYWILIINIFLSWVPEVRNTKIGRFLTWLGDPYMRIFRGLLVFGMLDFTPIIGFILYNLGLSYFAQMINLMISNL